MPELIVVESKEAEKAQEKSATASGCCEPECGPETCAPAASAEEERRREAQAGCCEPDCGPETCGS